MWARRPGINWSAFDVIGIDACRENERSIHEAYVYTFFEESPYSPELAYDLHMASFGIFRLVMSDGKEIDPEAYWEPEAASHALAERGSPAVGPMRQADRE